MDSAELDKEIQDALSDMSLMDMDEPKATSGGTELKTGTVVAVEREDILVDMGGKSTGLLPIKALGSEPIPEVGTKIQVIVKGYNADEGLIMLSREDAVEAAAWDSVERGQVVQGIVRGHNKGGLELTIDGIKAFMPISQIDTDRIEDDQLSKFVGQKMTCQIMDIKRSEKSLVVSRREVMKKEAAAEREKKFETLSEGDTVTGTVRTIMPYGAFVDIGGTDGLLHIGDMSHARVEDPKDVVSEGQTLELKVIKIDRENKKIGLGLKQALSDPWSDAEDKWPVDSIVSGRVTRLADFGAFVELEPGLDGLIPISEMSFGKRINHPREVVNEGEIVKTRVINLDLERRRIGLSIKRLEDDPWQGASLRWPAGTVVEGRISRTADFGAFVELSPGVEGLIHISEISTEHVQNVSDKVREGDMVKARVLDVDEGRRRMSLSIKQAEENAEEADFSNYLASGGEGGSDRPRKKRKKPLRGGMDF